MRVLLGIFLPTADPSVMTWIHFFIAALLCTLIYLWLKAAKHDTQATQGRTITASTTLLWILGLWGGVTALAASIVTQNTIIDSFALLPFWVCALLALLRITDIIRPVRPHNIARICALALGISSAYFLVSGSIALSTIFT